MDDSGRRDEPGDELVGGWGGPLRRWRAMDARDRVGTLLVTGVGAVTGTAAYWLVAQLFFGGASGPTLVFWLVWMFLFTFYQPELVRTFKKWND